MLLLTVDEKVQSLNDRIKNLEQLANNPKTPGKGSWVRQQTLEKLRSDRDTLLRTNKPKVRYNPKKDPVLQKLIDKANSEAAEQKKTKDDDAALNEEIRQLELDLELDTSRKNVTHPHQTIGGKLIKRKSNKRKSNKRKSNKRKSNKRKSNKRKSNKRKHK